MAAANRPRAIAPLPVQTIMYVRIQVYSAKPPRCTHARGGAWPPSACFPASCSALPRPSRDRINQEAKQGPQVDAVLRKQRPEVCRDPRLVLPDGVEAGQHVHERVRHGDPRGEGEEPPAAHLAEMESRPSAEQEDRGEQQRNAERRHRARLIRLHAHPRGASTIRYFSTGRPALIHSLMCPSRSAVLR